MFLRSQVALSSSLTSSARMLWDAPQCWSWQAGVSRALQCLLNPGHACFPLVAKSCRIAVSCSRPAAGSQRSKPAGGNCWRRHRRHRGDVMRHPVSPQTTTWSGACPERTTGWQEGPVVVINSTLKASLPVSLEDADASLWSELGIVWLSVPQVRLWENRNPTFSPYPHNFKKVF